MANKSGISIVIVNWNSAEYLRQCLESLVPERKSIEFEVVVVDNATFDGADKICSGHPFARYIQLDVNAGFARANNIGANEAGYDSLLFLNPDTVVKSGALEKLYAAVHSTTSTGAAGARLLNSDGSLQISCLLPFPTIPNLLIDIDFIKLRMRRLPLWGIEALFKTGSGPFAVQAISGACIMVQKVKYDSVGGFSEDYFMYSEDIDLCYKLHKSGLQNIYVPHAEVVHFGGGSTKAGRPSKFSTVMMQEAKFTYFKKFHGLFYSMLFRVATMISSVIRISILSFHSLVKKESSSLFKWICILRWTVGLEKWAKEINRQAQ